MSKPPIRAVVHFALALSLLFAPMLPAFAGSVEDGRDAVAHAHHADHDPAPITGQGDVHKNCNGHCCLACAMHFVSVAVPWLGANDGRSVQIPSGQHYHPVAVITPPDRPPRNPV